MGVKSDKYLTGKSKTEVFQQALYGGIAVGESRPTHPEGLVEKVLVVGCRYF